MLYLRLWGVLLLLFATAKAEQLTLPPRPADAPSGSEFAQLTGRMPVAERENWIMAEILRGNVPDFLRTFVPISFQQTLNNIAYTVQLQVLPDYLAVGSDTDYLLTPMTPLLAQRLADRLNCVLPTRKLVNVSWTNAAVKLSPQSIAPSPQMTTMPVFVDHNTLVRAQRNTLTNMFPPGALVAGHKKDVVISSRIHTNFANASITKPVVIYGWHHTSGSPIQPLYNGHEQTYADYSHGIRLWHDQLFINGQSNRISQVLTNPALAPLLSDESAAEGSPGNVIRNLRYTINSLAPAILQHPRSLRLLMGETGALTVSAVADPDPQLLWFRPGLPIAQASAASLSVTGEPSCAGAYWVVASNALGQTTSRVAQITVSTNRWPVVFAERFEDPAALWHDNWQVMAGGTDGSADYALNWAYDHGYSPFACNRLFSAIPAAPGSEEDEHRALRLQVNANDATGAEAAVNVWPLHLPALRSNYLVSFDLWINYPGNAGGNSSTGSTQHALFGLGHTGQFLNWPLADTGSDGVWFAVSGEGGDTKDYRAYRGQPGAAPLDLTGPGASMIAANNSALPFQQLFAAGKFETSGSPGKNWVRMELHATNEAVLWFADGRLLAAVPNPHSNSGTLMLGLADLFKSIANPAQDSFALFDNLTVEETSGGERLLWAGFRAPRQFELSLSAVPGQAYWLQRSTNLVDWEPPAEFVTNRPPLFMRDAAASTAPASVFYRIQRKN